MKSMLSDPKPVRKIRPSSRSITGKFASKKTSRTHYFESTLERDYLLLLESDPAVDSFVAQPLTIHYTFEGKLRRYTPDVLIHFTDEANKNPCLVEIKYAAELELKRIDLQPRFDAACRYAEERNFTFIIITEKQIRTDYLDNLKFLSRYKSGSIDTVLRENILEKLQFSKHLKVHQLVTGKGLEANGKTLNTVWQLLSAEIVHCDMQTKITMNTLIWMNTAANP